MNSAVLIIGHLRSFENNYKNLELLIEKINCDIFICMSNIQFDLHPYIKTVNNFYNDCSLSLNLINIKLSICKNMKDKIKKIILLDNIEENNDIINNYLYNFDNKKKWKGIDIFKQYNKIKKCVDYVKNYEIENNIKYNYIMKIRFDINFNFNTLPQYPLLKKTFYSNNNSNHSIDDICLISDSINNFEVLCEDFNKHFFNNSEDINVYNSVHTILYHIIKSNNFNSIQSINSNINKDYNSCFDTNITLVTCFYNINRDKWKSCSRPIETYFENTKNVLNKKNPIVIFTTESYVERCLEIRKKTDIHLIYTQIVVIPFEQLMYYDKIDKIREIQQNNINNIPFNSRNCPEFCIPEYIIIINNKINFLKKVANENIFNSIIFQWVDFGLHKNIYNNNSFNDKYFSNIFYKKDKIKIISFIHPKNINDKIYFSNSNLSTTAGGLIAGDCNTINKFYDLCKNEFEYMLNNNIMNQEQYIYYYVLCQYPNLFDYSIINNWNNLCQEYSKNTTKIAICMSGNVRTFNLCKDNIQNNIINPLINAGCHINTFFSTWTDKDFINNLDILNNFFTKIESEIYDVNSFIDYNTQQYLQFPGLCGSTTSLNATSCHYKIKKSYELSKEYSKNNNINYDIIIRIRPDIIYNNTIDIGSIKQSLLTDYLYMPNSHGKYTSVTINMMDHFFYGNITCMNKIMNTFDKIITYLSEDCIHTAEGFLYKNICENFIKILRVFYSYDIIRKNNQYENVYN